MEINIKEIEHAHIQLFLQANLVEKLNNVIHSENYKITYNKDAKGIIFERKYKSGMTRKLFTIYNCELEEIKDLLNRVKL